MHLQSVQFLRQCVGHFFIPTPSLPPRFSLTTCSSFLPFSFVSRNNFMKAFRDAELVGRLKYNSSILGHQFSLSSFRSVPVEPVGKASQCCLKLRTNETDGLTNEPLPSFNDVSKSLMTVSIPIDKS